METENDEVEETEEDVEGTEDEDKQRLRQPMRRQPMKMSQKKWQRTQIVVLKPIEDARGNERALKQLAELAPTEFSFARLYES